MPHPSDLAATRLSLHAVAELLLAGPQYDASGTIRLRVTPGGFATVALPTVSVVGTELVVGMTRVGLHGRTITEVAAAAGVVPRSLADVYADATSQADDEPLRVEAEPATEIAAAFRRGHEALLAFAPEEEPVLWPEHFDLAVSVDQVNYGVSPGDTYRGVPYAYVGPWSPGDLSGDFWNAPFGAARPLTEIGDLAAFFGEGRALTAG